MAAETYKSWGVYPGKGFAGLQLKDVPVPISKPRDHEVLIKLHAASLNYRDLIISNGTYPISTDDGIVPGSDGAGVVTAVGSAVQRFKPGDRVLTQFNQSHIAGRLDGAGVASGLGGGLDGALREYATFPESGLVHAPSNLTLEEASTLSCAAVTAWNALYGIEGRGLKPGQWVLTQGTGGVSVFAVQFAKAAGARVIATTSSATKADKLKELGADFVINYREDEAWGETAKKLTGGDGVDHVLEVIGAPTMDQSLKALRWEGIMSVIGFVGGVEGAPNLLASLFNYAIVRGVAIGSRMQFEEMNRAIEANDIHPVVDQKVFKLEELREAYQYQWDQKHFGKVIVKIA